MTLRLIGMTLVHQRPDHRDHFRDVTGRTGLDVGVQQTQGFHILVKGAPRALRHLLDGFPRLVRGGNDLVVDVGDVADARHPFELVTQHAIEQVEGNERPGIADVGVVVDRRAAHVHAHMAWIERSERLLAARRRVVQRESQDQT